MPQTRGAIVSELQHASDVGVAILAKGGSAADAIIATILVIGTTCSYHSGIGGGGFAIIRSAHGYESLDFRHSAPGAATADFYARLDANKTAIGGLSVAVPGELRGLEEIHRRFGRLPWRTLVEPSIRLARDGFPFTHDCLTRIKQWTLDGPLETSWLLRNPIFSAIYAPATGIDASDNLNHPFPPIGTLLRNEEYARTLETIASDGAEAFYTGQIAEGIVSAVKADGGLLSLEDLAGYRGYKVTSVPAPGSGAIYLSALATLSQFEPGTGPDDAKDAHHLVESLKFAYAQRARLGDAKFVAGLDEAQHDWISPERASLRAAKISEAQTMAPDAYNEANLEIKDDYGTSNITAWDESGLVISITTTVTLAWGSRIIVPGYGIVLNDTMEDFSVAGRPNAWGLQPSPSNFIAGGKRALSSSCPYIVERGDGQVVLAGGCAGGSRIISANVQVTRNVIDYGMTAAEALRAPRLHDQIRPIQTEIEEGNPARGIKGFSNETTKRLAELGHNVKLFPRAMSNPCAIAWTESGGWEPAGETRLMDSGGAVIQ